TIAGGLHVGYGAVRSNRVSGACARLPTELLECPAGLLPRSPRAHRSRATGPASVPPAAERSPLRARAESTGDAEGARADGRSPQPRDAPPPPRSTVIEGRPSFLTVIEGWHGFAGPPRALGGLGGHVGAPQENQR